MSKLNAGNLPQRYDCTCLRNWKPEPRRQENGSRADWLLFMLIIAMLIAGAAAFVAGYVLIAATAP